MFDMGFTEVWKYRDVCLFYYKVLYSSVFGQNYLLCSIVMQNLRHHKSSIEFLIDFAE